MELYNEKINEYVDWVTGDNSLTGENDTGNLPVSGEQIRNLLLNRLKNPVTIIRDKKAKLYRVFSSESSRLLWESNSTKYKDLELANFVAPSEYGIIFKIQESGNVRYIREGVPGQSGSYLIFEWSIENDKGNVQEEPLYLTLTLDETGQSKPYTISSLNKRPTIDIYNDFKLVSGTNTIKINGRGAVTGATIDTEIIINTVQLDIRTSLDILRVLTVGNPLLFNLYATRNVTGSLVFEAKRYCYGANLFNSGALSSITSDIPISLVSVDDLNPNVTYSELNNPPLESGLHAILVVARMDIQNQNFYSNMIYYLIGVNKDMSNNISGAMTDDRIVFKYEYNDNHIFVSDTNFILELKLYETTYFDWAYIRLGTDQRTKTILWYLLKLNSLNSEDFSETFISLHEVSSGLLPKESLKISPLYYSVEGYDDYLIARVGTSELIRIPVKIHKSAIQIGETTGVHLGLKLSASGKSNDDTTSRGNWTYTSNNTTYRAIFTGIDWNEASGWYDNSLRLSGIGSNVTINYNPFNNLNMVKDGATIEIEFESEYVQSTDDVLVKLGGELTYIVIKPNKASLFVNNTELITTNYKANEHVKLAFIIEPSSIVSEELQKVVFIVNNGICERAASWDEIEGESFSLLTGNIKIGGCNSGVRVYNIRCYNEALTILNAFNNYLFDSENKGEIYTKNDIYTNGSIDINKCRDKIDIIRITGDLSSVLARGTKKDKSNTTCNIERICDYDPTKNFVLTNGRIRKHGQSTLTYPLTSYKLWFNSSATDGVDPSLVIDEDPNIPFNKNRYLMKDNSIPSNKFVLLANYADSSGVHNGGLLRLILDTWYKAKINGEYKLRTQPQLFVSNQTISPQPGDSAMTQIVGEKTELTVAGRLFCGMNELGKQWKDYFGDTESPYIIRNAPDSFPCLLFYKNTAIEKSTDTLLGQYVFMDDKKSDFVYGERSIYFVKDSGTNANNANDPFCMKRNSTGESVWDEKSGEKIWDNKNVLRIECLSVNSTLADYRGYYADNSGRRYDDIILGNSEKNTSIGWEEDFELVYPDKEDITLNKVFSATKFLTTVQPFTDWLGWVINTKLNYSLMGYNSAQEAFENTASSHLDLYKMAAYYIFVLRFGLVDSLERNAQIKTYDGRHFHYEPWDMDIALGNRNTGGIAFDPPIDRNTMLDDTTAAISGNAKIDTNNDDIADTWVSNWLWDALEAWDYFMNTIVKDTADALYDAGLTYANSIKMFDEEYQDKWSERIYNHSGNFKYVVNRLKTDEDGNITEGYDNTWLAWLQGARTTHRHWWLKSSMDYYDAKWGVGEFMRKRVYLACEMHNKQGSINIIPTSDTFFSFTREADLYGPFAASASGYSFSIANINSGAKVPFYINGANFIKELDISIIAEGLQTIQLDGAYSEDVGPIITKLNIGVKFTSETPTSLIGQRNGKAVNFTVGHALDAIEELNIRGQNGSISVSFLQDIKTIKKLYAAGAGIGGLITAPGTVYEILELPDTITSLTFNDSKWSEDNLSFWTTIPGGDREVTYTYDEPLYDPETDTYFTEETVVEYLQSLYNKYLLPGVTLEASTVKSPIPRSLTNVRMSGTTGGELCSRQFLHDWIYSIIDLCTYDWQNSDSSYYSTAHEYNTLDEYITYTFNTKRLVILNIFWNNDINMGGIPGLTYQELCYLAMFNGIDYSLNFSETGHPNVSNFSRGYVVMTNAQLNGIQASLLSTWFGEGAFTLNSDGLTIDNENTITTITVGPSAYVLNGEIYLIEGEEARLTSTRFKLQLLTGELSFSFRNPSNVNESLGLEYYYPGTVLEPTCKILSQHLEGEDYYYYLKTYPSTVGEPYNIVIGSGNSTQLIHILPLNYPLDIQLGIEINDNMLSIRGGLSTNPKTNSYESGNTIYYSSLNMYSISAGSLIVLGLLFKEDNKYFYDFLNDDFRTSTGEINGYVKFQIYKNGTLLPSFETPKEYYEFTEGSVLSPNGVDGSYLQYYTGFKKSNTSYKYFIPLIVSVNPIDPIKYTVVAEVKMGGKISRISLDIIVVDKQIIAEEGTLLWGIIDGGYYSVHNEHFEQRPFYRCVAPYITGTIGNGGVYYSNGSLITVQSQINTLTSLRYGQRSVLYYLPYITGINLAGASLLPSSTITNDVTILLLDLSKVIDLRILNLDGCSSLTLNIDLTMYPEITEVDASGTTINVLVPEGNKLTKYEVGVPTTVSLINPTVLTPALVVVDSYANITSIDLVKNTNGHTCNLFNMFDKIMDKWVVGGIIRIGLYYNNNGTLNSEYISYSNVYTTDYIPVTAGHLITVSVEGTKGGCSIVKSDYSYSDSKDTYLSNEIYSRTFTLGSNAAFMRVSNANYTIGTSLLHLTITDDTTNTLLFEYKK